MANLLMPEGSVNSLGITQYLNVGAFKERLLHILTSDDLSVTEVSNEEYLLMRDILMLTGVDFKVVVNIPEIDSPQSFLFEDELDHVVSYDLIELKPKSEGEQFIEDVTNGGIGGDLLDIENTDIEESSDVSV